jgi:hypothetical protein
MHVKPAAIKQEGKRTLAAISQQITFPLFLYKDHLLQPRLERHFVS